MSLLPSMRAAEDPPLPQPGPGGPTPGPPGSPKGPQPGR